MNRFKFYLMILAVTFSAWHPVLAVNYPVNTDNVLAITVAEEGYTRLSLDDEVITDIFVFPENSLQVQIHKSGYAILVPSLEKDREGKTIRTDVYLTVSGSEGTTQDMVLRFAGNSPKPVKLVKFNLGKEFNKDQSTNNEVKEKK
ncbi:MAG: hypothetical protein EBY20_01205 [Alphaproteobacteria bacterium]|jgi:hypothetical protein|nr:hypothetical protein [Alphaproteobacteria bacterium]